MEKKGFSREDYRDNFLHSYSSDYGGDFAVTADLRGCKKALDSYFGGISRGNYSMMNSAFAPESREKLSAEEQESYMTETFGKYVGTVDKGVRITYSVKGMGDVRTSSDVTHRAKQLFIEVRAKSSDFDEQGNAMVFLYKVKGKWYVDDVKVA